MAQLNEMQLREQKIKLWSLNKETLLREWAEKAVGYRWLHEKARRKFSRLHDMLSYPTIVITTTTGVGGFAIINTNDANDNAQSSSILFLRYFFAFLNVLGSILHAISKFNNSAQLCERHTSVSIEYAKFYRTINMELSLEKDQRQDAIKFISHCRKEFDKILSNAPTIPSTCIKQFNETFPNKRNRPDVCNGLGLISFEEDSDIVGQV